MGFKVGDNINKAEKVFANLVHTSTTVYDKKTLEIPGFVGAGDGLIIEAGSDNKIKKIKLTSGCP